MSTKTASELVEAVRMVSHEAQDDEHLGQTWTVEKFAQAVALRWCDHLGITEEMVAAFDLLDEADFCDMGPVGEGWKSDERAQEVAALQQAHDALSTLWAASRDCAWCPEHSRPCPWSCEVGCFLVDAEWSEPTASQGKP